MSSVQTGDVAIQSNQQSTWTQAGVDTYGFRTTSLFNGGSPSGGLLLNQLDGSAGNQVSAGHGGLGVNGGGGNDLNTGEYLVMDLGGKSSAVAVSVSGFSSGETLQYYAYDQAGHLIGQGAQTGAQEAC